MSTATGGLRLHHVILVFPPARIRFTCPVHLEEIRFSFWRECMNAKFGRNVCNQKQPVLAN